MVYTVENRLRSKRADTDGSCCVLIHAGPFHIPPSKLCLALRHKAGPLLQQFGPEDDYSAVLRNTGMVSVYDGATSLKPK